jgi:hypothetical protein
MPDADEGPKYTGFIIKSLNLQIFYEAAMLKCVRPTVCSPLSYVVVANFRPEEGLAPEILIRKMRELIEAYERNPERFGG